MCDSTAAFNKYAPNERSVPYASSAMVLDCQCPLLFLLLCDIVQQKVNQDGIDVLGMRRVGVAFEDFLADFFNGPYRAAYMKRGIELRVRGGAGWGRKKGSQPVCIPVFDVVSAFFLFLIIFRLPLSQCLPRSSISYLDPDGIICFCLIIYSSGGLYLMHPRL